MLIVTYNGTQYECSKAIKSSSYIELRDAANNPIGRFDGITDFSGFAISGGSWSEPDGVADTRATAKLSGGNLLVTPDDEIGDGTLITLTAPCNCSSVTGAMIINEVSYTIVDALDTDVAGKNAWCSGAKVSFIINKTAKKAYVQNQAMVGSVVKWDNINVPVSGWKDATGGGYTNTVSVSGVLSTDNPHTVDIVRDGSADAIKQAMIAFSKIYRITTKNGSIELYAPYAKPAVTFSIRMEGTR